VKDQMNYYKHYEKFMKMTLEQSIVKTSEYHSFSEIYPHITESIRLKREIKRLNNKLKSEKERSAKFKIKKEITITKTKLKKNNLLKRLHGESKQEAIFQRKLKLGTTKMHVTSLAKKGYTTLRQATRKLRRKLRRSMHRNLPPSIFNLRELDTAEKGLALREWIQEKHKQHR
jgi:predicted  nucleic acid-binding Zn-ribbon protein